MSSVTKVRFVELDIARSIAIIIMIVANAAPVLLADESVYPVFRVFCSLAAPLFIFISGVTFRVNIESKKEGLLKKAFYLFCSAAFVDIVVWRILPFYTYDVLYLTAFSQLITYIIFKLRPNWRLVSFFLIAVLSFVAHQFIVYRFEISDISISDLTTSNSSFSYFSVLQRLFFDGWFPILPWLLVFLSGALISFQRLRDLLTEKKNMLVGLWFLFIVSFVFLATDLKQEIRNSYIEVFYPFSGWVVIVAVTWLVSAISLAKSLRNSRVVLNYIQLLGKKSLLVYILHLAVISYVFSGLDKMSGFYFGFISLVFVVIIWLVIYLVSKDRSRLMIEKFVPVFLRKIIGL